MERCKRRTDFMAVEQIEIDDRPPAAGLDPAKLQLCTEEDCAAPDPDERFFAVYVQVPEMANSEWLGM